MKLFGWWKFKVSEEEREHTQRAMLEAERVAQLAESLHTEAKVVGERQRLLRQDNHFGRSLDHIFKGAQ
ncbi:hypothetical protein SEA_JKERNS_26 [Arthrobacter phage JKerns]|uniref:Uncharacterized protein n=4 Tax=Marthavirus TaxID=1980936 RepID=A0A0U4II31_9CAUD|nr:hypothetical protein FDH50_gp26 [Arthrobacter phage Sonny]YP_009612479.1 hypothetical protein FDI42_gp26 [Arthrobacter phage Shade]YP_009884247.1 hypothetical protein HYP98_gp26 [Arthrobacter phage Zartrosa]ASR80579.1 hypothetical protein SEA_JORDAN_26 [Arthrobacter phage Jordan]QIQ62838.1 hypothetical protein SEA_JKERNS_26 [Arthrobacter phage JKerns]ALY10294.1 hypothetical protein SONNY_26 [Arthrobacter phage Sonny]ASR80731.1 hypothetical protein SEA_SHADE_26 [Arthrobacter phage Shade]QE